LELPGCDVENGNAKSYEAKAGMSGLMITRQLLLTRRMMVG